jgi:glutaredoxin
VGEQVELITRSGCHLCEDAERALREAGVPFQARDVDSDPELFRLYDWRVPVLLLEGRVASEGVIDSDRIRELRLG